MPRGPEASWPPARHQGVPALLAPCASWPSAHASARECRASQAQPAIAQRYGEASERFERRLVAELHDALGIGCRRRGGAYELVGAAAAAEVPITPLDRFNIVGNRSYDGVHPTLPAQYGLVQLLLNHLCSST